MPDAVGGFAPGPDAPVASEVTAPTAQLADLDALLTSMGIDLASHSPMSEVRIASGNVTVIWSTADADGIYVRHEKAYPVVWA